MPSRPKILAATGALAYIGFNCSSQLNTSGGDGSVDMGTIDAAIDSFAGASGTPGVGGTPGTGGAGGTTH